MKCGSTSLYYRVTHVLRIDTGPGRPPGKWVQYVMLLCEAQQDLRSLPRVGQSRMSACSTSSLRESCYVLRIQPKDGRIISTDPLRVILRCPHEWRPENFLDVADRRTLEVLSKKAGFGRDSVADSLLDHFFRHQSFIEQTNPVLLELQVCVRSACQRPSTLRLNRQGGQLNLPSSVADNWLVAIHARLGCGLLELRNDPGFGDISGCHDCGRETGQLKSRSRRIEAKGVGCAAR